VIVGPDQRGVVDLDGALAQQPVGKAAVALAARHLDARDCDGATAVAPDVQCRAVDVEGVESQFQHREGQPRKRQVHPRQPERGTPRRVVHGQISELELRPQAFPVGGYRFDRDLLTRALAHDACDVLAVALDVRQDPVAQRDDGARQGERDCEQSPGQYAVHPQRTDAQPAELRVSSVSHALPEL
jgi:hypothetical protein